MLKNRRCKILMASFLFLALAWTFIAQPLQAQDLMTNFKVGDPAPDFTHPDQGNNKITLSDFKGKKNVVLAFYVLAFTGG